MKTYNTVTHEYGEISFREKYFSFEGRLGRKEFLMRSLWLGLEEIVMFFI